MYDLNKVYNECISEAKSVGIKPGKIVSIKSSRRKSSWGRCVKGFKDEFSISISSTLLNDDISPLKALKETILHEICHTVDNCFNHGYNWKKETKKLEKLGYKIKSSNTLEEKNIGILDYYKYAIMCKKCGNIHGAHRISKIIKYPSCVICGKCNEINTFIRIK